MIISLDSIFETKIIITSTLYSFYHYLLRELHNGSFIEPIGGFIALLVIGVMCGGIGFVMAYRN